MQAVHAEVEGTTPTPTLKEKQSGSSSRIVHAALDAHETVVCPGVAQLPSTLRSHTPRSFLAADLASFSIAATLPSSPLLVHPVSLLIHRSSLVRLR